MEGLTVGRIVHFGYRNQCRAAVVTYVWNFNDGCVNLHVFKD